jgi:hypothetical protein
MDLWTRLCLPVKEKKGLTHIGQPLAFHGRDDWIRTSDFCVPNAALYQAEPRPDLLSGDSTLIKTALYCPAISAKLLCGETGETGGRARRGHGDFRLRTSDF